MLFIDYVAMFQEDGFEVVRETKFSRTGGVEEDHVIMWHRAEGILATAESYRGTSLNDAHVHYNIDFDPDRVERGEVTPWSLISSGMFDLDEYDAGRRLWVGHHNGRSGIRGNLARLRSAGTFQAVWKQRPYLSLLTSGDWRTIGMNFKESDALREQIISELPEHVRTAITPASK
jgi:hypothetical protein